MRSTGHRPPTTRCEQCHADVWVQRRASWPAGVLHWLGSGGSFRPTRSVCRVCGAVGGGSAWVMVLTGAPANRWSLPYRVVRSVVLTVQGHRHVQPVPWIYLASGLLGAVVATVPDRPRCRPLVAVAGAAGGALLCWAGFASTARSTPRLTDELLTAALQEVSPERASARRRARDVGQAATASFPVYDTADADGSCGLAGRWLGLSSQDEVVTSVLLAHGDPTRPTDPWLHVTSSTRAEAVGRDEDSVADALRERVEEEDPTHGVLPAWQDAVLVVDGHEVPARRLDQGRYWSVVAPVGDVQVVVEAHDVPATPALVRVRDLVDRYA